MTNSAELMIQYLLGELTEQERIVLEEKYFSDSQAFDELTRIENELVDNYVRGRLSNEQRRQFEQAYLTNPKRRQRVRFAEALITTVDKQSGWRVEDSSNVSWWLRFFAPLRNSKLTAGLAVACIALLVVCCVWLFVEFRRVRQELAQVNATRTTLEQRQRELQQLIADEENKANRLAEELNQVRNAQSNRNNNTPPITTSSFVSLAIVLSSTRNSNTDKPHRLVIPPSTTKVRLQILLNENSYPGYVVRVQTADGREVFSQLNIKARGGRRLNLSIPASSFETGDYLLTVQGGTHQGDVEDLSKSLIHVEKHLQ